MPSKRRDCAGKLLAATNPFSIYRSRYVMLWTLLAAVLFCGVTAGVIYFCNRMF